MEEEGQVGRPNVANLTEWATQWKEERLTRLQPWGDFFDRCGSSPRNFCPRP